MYNIDYYYRPYRPYTGGQCPNCGYCPCCGRSNGWYGHPPIYGNNSPARVDSNDSLQKLLEKTGFSSEAPGRITENSAAQWLMDNSVSAVRNSVQLSTAPIGPIL